MQARRLRIHGLVQGVCYRWSMVQEAQRLGARGWVRNRGDGTVEALIGGPDQVLAQLITWAQRGPDGAEVSRTEVEWAELEHLPPEGFSQWPTL